MSNPSDIELFFTPSIERARFPYQGTIHSKVLDGLAEQAGNDLIGLGALHNALVSRVSAQDAAAHRDVKFLAKQVSDLMEELKYQRQVRSENGVRITNWHTFRDTGPISFLSGTPLSRRAMVDGLFGEATVPLNAIQSKFYSTSPRTGRIIPDDDLSIDVTGSFDKQDGDGVVDREYTSQQTRLDEGTPSYAFNGTNLDRWVRRIEFDLDSDVDSVETQITVRVPPSQNPESNVLTINPHPVGCIDILGLFTAPDLSDSFTQVSSFSSVESTWARRWFFPAAQVQQIRIWLRQRNWVEENGKKVFYIGAEEIGLFLADWDKTYEAAGELTDNHSVVTRVDAPSGYRFATLHNFRTDPFFTLEDDGSRHLHFQIATDEAFTNVVWDSDSDALPQTLSQGLALGGTSGVLYVLSTLNWVQSSGGVSSPFEVNTPPYLRGFGLETSVVEE